MSQRTRGCDVRCNADKVSDKMQFSADEETTVHVWMDNVYVYGVYDDERDTFVLVRRRATAMNRADRGKKRENNKKKLK